MEFADIDINELQQCIETGDYQGVRTICDPITDNDQVNYVVQKCSEHDPVMKAVVAHEEDIALYLIKKGFPFKIVYKDPDKTCDQWCQSEHRGRNYCSHSQFDVRSFIEKQRPEMVKLRQFLSELHSGARKPTDSLNPNVPTVKSAPLSRPKPTTLTKKNTMMTVGQSSRNSPAQAASALVDQFGTSTINKQGNTLLHLQVHCGQPVHAYVLAHRGIPVNHQNVDGDTALHVAAKCDERLYARALIQCGAQLDIRNRLGQTVLDVSKGETRKFLSRFEPGLLPAVIHGRHRAVEYMLRLWCFHDPPNVKNGHSLMEVVQPVAEKYKHVFDVVRRLKDCTVNMNLIHAVLSNNNPAVKRILDSRLNWNVNLRYQDNRGRTLLQTAIEYHDLELVQMLVEAGARRNVRVRTNEKVFDDNKTIPLLRVALEPEVPFDIFLYLLHNREESELHERDFEGNTVLLWAIREMMPLEYIEAIVTADPKTLLDRGSHDRLHARELADSLGFTKVVSFIDRFIARQVSVPDLWNMAIHFYGLDNLNVLDRGSNRTLLQIATEKNDLEMITVITSYSEVEDRAKRLFAAVLQTNIPEIKRLNKASYRDKNGYTALIKAIVHERSEVVEHLIDMRPALKSIPDNSNRYPLHYAYALDPEVGEEYVLKLLEKNPDDIEALVDKNGCKAADYSEMRETEEILNMLQDAKSLDLYGKAG